MHNDKGQVTDWLEEIVREPDEWQMFFSSSEVKTLAEDTLELLKERHPVEMDLCNGEPFCPTCGSIVRCYYNFCEECGQKFKKDSEGHPIFR